VDTKKNKVEMRRMKNAAGIKSIEACLLTRKTAHPSSLKRYILYLLSNHTELADFYNEDHGLLGSTATKNKQRERLKWRTCSSTVEENIKE
jgi:hypothetical protein